MPQEVGEALLHYLRQSRPPLRTPEVFTTVVAPVRPLTRAAVTHIVRAALCRTGIKAPINGAHVLRHSAATTMLRQGASLAGIGAVLRHRSPRTTAHYAEVNFNSFRRSLSRGRRWCDADRSHRSLRRASSGARLQAPQKRATSPCFRPVRRCQRRHAHPDVNRGSLGDRCPVAELPARSAA